MHPDQIAETCARAAHDVNNAYNRHIGDQPIEWDAMPDGMRAGTIYGARMALAGKTPEEMHESWMASRLADGWTLGAIKDITAKVSPCLVPYAELPEVQRRKDALFQAVVLAMADALR